MNERTRYQAQSVHLTRDSVTAYRGVDPVTGLPVLIYRYRGTAAPDIRELDSDQLPRVLAWREDAGEGLVVVAFSSAYVPAGPLSARQLSDSATALAEAARHGVTHGDLSPERFLAAGDTVVLEGFGLPWTPGTSSAGDVRDWAASVLSLGHPEVPGLQELLERASGPDADARPDPVQLKEQLDRLLEPPAPEVTPPDVEPEEPATVWDSMSEEAPPPADPFADLGTLDFEMPEQPVAQEPEPEPLPAAPEPGPAAPPADDSIFQPSSGYASENIRRSADSKGPDPAGGQTLPPGTRYRSSEAPVPRKTAPPPPRAPQPESAGNERSSRRITMLVVLILLTVLLVVMVFLLQRRDPQTAGRGDAVTQAVTYVVQVLVEPANLPPVTLYVLESPAASELRPNTILGTAPRSIALDAAGTWVFQGRFQGRESEPVTLQIPEQRASTITVVIPPEAED